MENYNNDVSKKLGSFETNLFDDYESKLLKMQGLLELTKVITSTLKESKLHQLILYSCQGQFLVHSATLILLKDSEMKTYEHVFSTGLKQSKYDIELKNDSELIELFTRRNKKGALVLEKRPYLSLQINRFLGWKEGETPLSILTPEIIVPLWGRNSFYGFLILGPKLDYSSFNSEELETLRQFCELASMSIENARLFDMAILDKMTGLLNQHFFKNCLYDEINRFPSKDKSLCLVMFDLDHFKSVNDAHGHQVGDFILKNFARVMKKAIKSFYLAGRYGGEEFIVLLPHSSLDDALELANEVSTRFKQIRFKTKTDVFSKTTSIGIAEFKEGISGTDFIEMADKALYHSKNNGRDQITVYKEGL